MEEIIAYKLFRVRKDGTLGPLFINARQRVPVGVWLEAESHPTKGYAYRPGWHASIAPVAPHLSEKGRAWFKVALRGAEKYDRPESQGGTWFVAKELKVLESVTWNEWPEDIFQSLNFRSNNGTL